jgi:transcriptional regulator with XRE-family HTH domain
LTRSGNVPNKQLRRHRLLRGWSLDDLASAVIELGKQLGERNLALTAKTVGRWERGESNPRAPYPKLLCALFGTSAEELGLGGGRTDLSSAINTTAVLDARLDPRTILGALGSGLVQPLLSSIVFERRQRAALAAPRGMDSTAADLISRALGIFRRLDDRLGSHAVVRPSLELRSLVEHVGQFPLGAEARDRLSSVGAELSQFLGWLAFDGTDHSTARAYYQEGLRAAREGTDQNLLAYLLGHIAILACTEGKIKEAITVVDSHMEQVAQTACLLTRSWFSAVEAFVHAIAGESASCLASLDRSRKAFSRAESGKGPEWLYSFDGARLLAYEGACFELIGELDRARDTWERALSSLSRDRVRERGIYLVHLAGIYARQGEVENACLLGMEAVAIASETTSLRVNEQINLLRVQLEPWKETAAVRELDRQLAYAR